MFYILHILCVLFFIPGLILTIPLHVLAYVSKRGQKKQLAELKGIRAALERSPSVPMPGADTDAFKAPDSSNQGTVKAILWIALAILLILPLAGVIKP